MTLDKVEKLQDQNTKGIQQLLNVARSKSRDYLNDVLVPVAAFVVLRWAERQEIEAEAVASFDDYPIKRILTQDLAWSAWSELDPSQLRQFLSERLWPALSGLKEGDLAETLRRVAQTFNPQQVGSDLLHAALSWVFKQPVETVQNRQRFSESFESLIDAVIASTRYGGEFLTPRGVVKLLVDLADPQPGERIYDPCFGTGGLLAAAGRKIVKARQADSSETRIDAQRQSLHGIEIQPALFLISMARLVLAGTDRLYLECEDALGRGVGQDCSSEGFDCILADLPFGGKVSREISSIFPIKTTAIEPLFLQHIMSFLKPGGRAVVIVPDSVLFRSGPDARVREQLLTEFRIAGVFSLPSGAFKPYTAIKTSILCFSRETPRKDVWFVEDKFTATALEPGKEANRPGLFGYLTALRRGMERRKGHSALVHELKRLQKSLLETDLSPGVEEPEHKQAAWDGMAVLSFLSSVEEMEVDFSFLRETWFPPIAWRVSCQDLAARNFELIVKRTGAEEVDALLKELQKASLEIPFATLGDIAEIFSGVEYRRSVVSEKPEEPESVGLIRETDIPKNGATSLVDHDPDSVITTFVRGEDGQEVMRNVSDFKLAEDRISSPTLFLLKEGLRRIKDRHRLRSGDILVTSSGTVGKVDLVYEDIVGCVPANSVVVIRLQKDLQPPFLRRLIQSGPYQDWFAGHAQGKTIRHLDVRTIRSLRVPIPPIVIQQQIGATLASGADAGLLLRAFVAGETVNEIESFLLSDPSIRNLLESREQSDDFESARSFSALAAALAPWEDRATQDKVGDEDLAVWLMKVTRLSRLVSGAFELPKGTERLAVLEGSRVQLTELQLPGVWDFFQNVGPSVRQRAEAIPDAIAKTIEAERRRLLEQVEISSSLEPSILDEGKLSEVTIRLKNESTLPLRTLHVQTEPERSNAIFQFFQVGYSISWPVTISPRPIGTYPLSVNWSAIRLDGEPTSDEISLAFEIRAFCATSRSDDLGDNPYIVGTPIERPEMFFGRRTLLDQIQHQLNIEHRANIILLEGNRRTGKSSVLKYLERPGELPGWIPAYCQFQSGEGDDKAVGLPTREVFYLMAKALALAIHRDGYSVEIPDLGLVKEGRFFLFHLGKALNRYFAADRPFESLEVLVAAWLEMVRPKRVLLMLDEFDKLQEGIDNGLTSPQVPENIRYLFHQYSDLSGILTGSRRLKRLREEYWSALFGLGYRIGLDPLELSEAEALVTEPVKSRLLYVPQARDQIVDLCARQPFLIQSLCNRIFEYCVRSGERTVTSHVVQAAADEMITDNEHFHTLWDYMETDRRRFLFYLIDRCNEGPNRISVELLEAKFNEYGVMRGKGERIGDDIDFLRELEVIEFDKSSVLSTYRAGIPLMARWLRKNKDWEDVRERAIREGKDRAL